MSSFTVDKPEKAFLSESDFTAVSFWIISIAMIAATVFFYAEAATVHSHWRTSLHVGGLVTLVAAVHYMYMREYWVAVHSSPIVYRYIDWSITVPLQMIEFNLILKAANAPIGPAGFWKLLIGTVLMLAFGYAGESGAINAWIGFGLGMCGWGFILFEIFAGESAKASAGGNVTVAVRQSYNNMRIIVSCGWAIYPAGYFLGQVNNTAGAAEALNVTYNIADFVNKIAFVLACWSCAKSDSSYSDEWSTLQIKSQGAKAEAAEKLIGNHIRVINDICNPSPVSQGNLARVSANNMGDVERMLLEVARRLSGNAGRSPRISAEVCSTTAAYLAQRTQSADSQCNGTPHQGRKADMSAEAAAAFLAEVKAVASECSA
jgi:bacteriorhodopsin